MSATQTGEPIRDEYDAGWMTTARAAGFLAAMFGHPVPSRTVQSWCKRSRDPLPHARLGAKVLIHKDELLAWVRRGGTGAAA